MVVSVPGFSCRWAVLAGAVFLLLACFPASSDPRLAAPRRGGVVIEEVGEGYALDAAGLASGDVVLAWRRLPAPPANPEPAQGRIDSIFDWLGLIYTQAPRGTVQLIVQRDGRAVRLEVAPSAWVAEARPALPRSVLDVFSSGRKPLDSAVASPAAGAWRRAADNAETWQARCWLLLRLAELWQSAGHLDSAHLAYEGALELSRDPVSEVEARIALSGFHRQHGDLELAQTAIGEMLPQLDDDLLAAKILSRLASLAEVRDDLADADGTARRALAIRERLAPGSLPHGSSLQQLGLIAWRRGSLERAADYHEGALAIRRRLLPGSVSVASSLQNLGWVAQSQGELEAAADDFERALVIKERLDSRGFTTAFTLDSLGEIAALRGDPGAARSRFQRALEIREALDGDSLETSISHGKLAGLALRQGELETAELHFQRLLEIRRKVAPQSLGIATGLLGLGRVHRRRGELETAAARLEEAAAAREAPVDRVGGSYGLRAGFRAAHDAIHHELVDLRLQVGQPAAAFLALEEARASLFLELVAERDTVLDSAVPAALEERRRVLAADYDAILRQRDEPPPDSPEHDERERERRRRREALDAVVEEIRRAAPRPARDPRPLAAAAAAAALDPGTVLVSFSVGAERLHVFTLSRGEAVTAASVDIGAAALAEKVWGFRDRIHQVRGPEPSEAPALRRDGRRLYDLLLRPVEDRLAAGERLLLIPDGPLHSLPFAALLRPREGAAPGEPAWQYLVEWKPIHSVLSATVYAELAKTRGRHADGPVAIFGDPRLPAAGAELADPHLHGATERGLLTLGPLPHARREAESIAALFPAAKVRVYLGWEATEERVRALVRGTRIVHFATHGYVDELRPLESALVLSYPAAPAEGRENGLLQAWEILTDLRLDADLVVLSACRSALGRELGGEGMVGLSRAFQVAGARSVVASLWQVADRSTADLMTRFYAHLRAGLPKDEALRAAQLELLRGASAASEPELSAPYHWAAFQLLGDRRS